MTSAAWLKPAVRAALAERGVRILRELGKGAMGSVFLARETATGQDYALKVMLPRVVPGPHSLARFRREAEITGRLSHPRIAALHRVDEIDETLVLYGEFCPGGSLDQWAARRHESPFTPEEVLHVADQAMDGLAHAHTQGVVHRDVTPQNILVSAVSKPNGTSGETFDVKVGDFGLAKAFDEAGLSGFTLTGTTAGRPQFMSRAQVVDFKYSGPEADVWSLAACLYWMLTLTSPRPFPPGADPWQVVLDSPPTPVRFHNPQVPRELAKAIDRALREEPGAAMTTMVELRELLSHCDTLAPLVQGGEGIRGAGS
ncbi:serine/threonine-protein kinase [Streptomyces sp. NPDC056296]|uniref:serine/threonine-protein kinase n=1 Tax=Streptomyces sp. NPDC056296 TaxID=3345775 RepID=UPI0035DDC006